MTASAGAVGAGSVPEPVTVGTCSPGWRCSSRPCPVSPRPLRRAAGPSPCWAFTSISAGCPGPPGSSRPRHAHRPAARAARKRLQHRLAVVRGRPELRQRPAVPGADRQRARRRQPQGPGRGPGVAPLAGRGAEVAARSLPADRIERVLPQRGKPSRVRPAAAWRCTPRSRPAWPRTVSRCSPPGCARPHTAFDWFLGRNDLGLEVYDATTGGCRDGLHQDRVNQNQGAESTVAFRSRWRR